MSTLGDIDFGAHPGLPWAALDALRQAVEEFRVEAPTFHAAAVSALDRHEPVPNHGRWSEEGCYCLSPAEHDEFHVGNPPRPLVCKSCRDGCGEPVEAPCDDLVDWGRAFGVDLR